MVPIKGTKNWDPSVLEIYERGWGSHWLGHTLIGYPFEGFYPLNFVDRKESEFSQWMVVLDDDAPSRG